MLMEERRRHPRVALAGVIEYRGAPGARCKEICNVSRGGLRLLVTAREKPGARVELRVALPQLKAFSALGQVVWARQSEPYEVGIRFLDLDPDAERTLEQHLSS